MAHTPSQLTSAKTRLIYKHFDRNKLDQCHKIYHKLTGRAMRVLPVTRTGHTGCSETSVLCPTKKVPISKPQFQFLFCRTVDIVFCCMVLKMSRYVGVFHKVECTIGHILCVSITIYARRLHTVSHCHAQCWNAGIWIYIIKKCLFGEIFQHSIELYNLDSYICVHRRTCATDCWH